MEELSEQNKIWIAHQLEHYQCSILSDRAKIGIVSFLVGFFIGVALFLI